MGDRDPSFSLGYVHLQSKFKGLGMGIKISTIPVFSAEVAPASVRGGLVNSFIIWVSFGVLAGFCSNLIFYQIGPLAWRFQLAAAFVPAIPILVLVWFCPGMKYPKSKEEHHKTLTGTQNLLAGS